MATQEIKIKIGVDADTGKLKIINEAVDDLGKKAKDSSPKVNSLRQGVEDLAHAGLALDFLKSAFGAVKTGVLALLDTAGEFEKYKAILTTLEGSSEKAGKSFDWVKEFASKTPYELNEVTKAFVKLKSYGIDPTDGILKTLGDTSAAMGKNINDAVEMMADAMTGENERLKEFGIKASAQGDYIKYKWTDSSGAAKETIVKNNSDVIKSTLGAIFNDKYQGSMDLLSNTWVGLTSNMADNWTQFKADLSVNSGLFDGAKEAVRTFNKEFSTISSNTEYMDVLGKSIQWGAVGIIQVAQGVSQVFTGWAMIWKGLETNYEQLKLNLSTATDQIVLKMMQAQASMDSFNPFSSKTAGEWDVAIKAQQQKINQQIAATHALDEQYVAYVKNLDSSNKIYDNLQDAFLKAEKNKQDGMAKTAEVAKTVSGVVTGKTEAEVAAEEKAKKEKEKLQEDHAKWVIDITKKTALAQSNEFEKPYVELQQKYDEDLKKYGGFTKAKDKLNEWYSAELDKLNKATAKKIEDQLEKETKEKAAELKKQEEDEKRNIIASSKQRQDYYEKIEDYASAWSELERSLRLDDTKLSKEELDKKIAYEKKAYLESKGIYEDLYTAISANITKSTSDWSNYNLIVGKGFGSMVTGLQSTMQSSLVDVFEGKIKSIGGFFSSLWDNVKKSFFNLVAELATKTIVMSFVNAWKDGGSTGQGFVEKFLGIDIPFLNFAEGTIWGSGKYGLAGGGYSAIDAYKNDTIPALISKGEAVIPASAVNKNKSVVSALIAGSRLDNRGLLDVSYIKKIADNYKGTSFFADGYDPSGLAMFDKASMDANGIYRLKGGGKGGILGSILGGILGVFTGGIGSALIGAVLGGAAGASGLLDPIVEMVSTVFQPLMKSPWLGWVLQAGLALTAPALIPAMLTSDLISTGITLATGGNLGDALGGAGISGLLAGGGAALSSLISTGALPATNLTFWETLQNYPSDLYKTTLDKFAQVKDFFNSVTSPSALVNPAAYIGVDETTWLESGSPYTYEEFLKREMAAQYANMSRADLFAGTSFGSGGSFLDYPSAYASSNWGFSSYDLIGQPASMSMVEIARQKLLGGFEYAKGLGTTAYNTLTEYLANPEKILQYVLDNLQSVLSNLVLSVSSMAGSPLVSALIGSSIVKGNNPFGMSGVQAFANGGIVTSPMLGLVGEAGYAEAIIPLHRLGEVTGMEEMRSELQEIKAILKEVLRADKTTSMWTERFAVEGIKTR